jgi:hypothetical protein
LAKRAPISRCTAMSLSRRALRPCYRILQKFGQRILALLSTRGTALFVGNMVNLPGVDWTCPVYTMILHAKWPIIHTCTEPVELPVPARQATLASLETTVSCLEVLKVN